MTRDLMLLIKNLIKTKDNFLLKICYYITIVKLDLSGNQQTQQAN